MFEKCRVKGSLGAQAWDGTVARKWEVSRDRAEITEDELVAGKAIAAEDSGKGGAES